MKSKAIDQESDKERVMRIPPEYATGRPLPTFRALIWITMALAIACASTSLFADEDYGYISLTNASIPCGVPTNTWIHLPATIADSTITVTAQQADNPSQGYFSYTDSSCNHMNGTIGLRTFNTAADWRNATVNETGSLRPAALCTLHRLLAEVRPAGLTTAEPGLFPTACIRTRIPVRATRAS
jgi:hypothetical protein